MDKALLPAGFHDSLAPEASKKAALMANLFMDLHKFGYELVEPPVIEFENSLFTGAGKALKDKTFRLMDPVSHKMMGVRSDITTQVARIAATRLKKSPKPLRLAYGGDVFRVKGEGLFAERQLTQGGIELVGIDNAAVDAEVILVTILSLKNLGLQGICVDFTLPRLIDIILSEIKFKDDDKTLISDAINKKNIAEIERLAGDNSKILLKLASGELKAADLLALKLPKQAAPLCARLAEVVSILEQSGEDVTISIDPLESEKFSYHSGLGFTIFVQGAKSEIGRGGRYEIEDDGAIIPAVGATIYINEILRILPGIKPQDKVFVPFGTIWSDLKKLSKGDKIIVSGTLDAKDIESAAKEQHCTHIYQNGEVKKL